MNIKYILIKLRLLIAILLTLAFLFLFIYTLIKYFSFNPAEISFQTTSSKIFDKNGSFLWEISKDNAVRNTPIKVRTLPKACINGIIAIEDKTFWTNNGTDVVGLARLLYSILVTKGTSGGGSTISQQVIKTSFLSIYNRDLVDKYFEILYAIRTNNVLSKETILEMYLNNIYFGELNYGIESASQNYFGKSSADLNLAECAYLSGIPQWPGVYNPYGNLNKGIERQKLVLSAMKKVESINEDDYNQALNFKLQFKLLPSEIKAPHFVQFVKDNVQKEYAEEIYSSLNIQSTYNYELHKKTLQILKEHISNNQESGFNNGAVAILDSENNIETLIGSVDFFNDSIDGKFNSALGLRQPGSAYAPILYMEALDSGLIEKSIMDNEFTNTSFINLNKQLAKELGVERISNKFNSLKRFNTFETKCSEILILEGCEISLLDLTSIYASNFVSNQRVKYVEKINEKDVIFNFSTEFYKYNSAQKVKELLNQNQENGWLFQIGEVVNNKDSFIIAWNQNYTIGVWIGNTNGDEFKKPEPDSLKNLIYNISKNLE